MTTKKQESVTAEAVPMAYEVGQVIVRRFSKFDGWDVSYGFHSVKVSRLDVALDIAKHLDSMVEQYHKVERSLRRKDEAIDEWCRQHSEELEAR